MGKRRNRLKLYWKIIYVLPICLGLQYLMRQRLDGPNDLCV